MTARLVRPLRRWWRRWRWCVMIAVATIAVAGAPRLRGWVGGLMEQRRERRTINSREYNGIDVSKHQGRIDWYAVAGDERIQFAYIKATEGVTHSDRRYATNIREARAAGIMVGSYHFFRAGRPAAEQWRNFRRHVDPHQQDLLPMVDVEESGCRGVRREALQRNLAEFMRLAKAEYGRYPLLYSQQRFYNDMLAPEYNRYLIVMARYSTTPPQLAGGGRHNIWQFTESGHIKGIRGAVDLNRFANGTTLDDIRLR